MSNGGSILLTGMSSTVLVIRNNGENVVSVMGDGTVQYHTDSPPEEAARLFWEALAQWSPIHQYEQYKEDHDRLVRQLDVLLNGKDGAARQAALCDMVSQVQRAVLLRGAPLLVLQAGGFEQWRDEHGFPVTSTQEPLWRRCWEAAQAATQHRPAARVDEGMVERGAAAIREVANPRVVGDVACIEFAERALKAALSDQPAPERQGAGRYVVAECFDKCRFGNFEVIDTHTQNRVAQCPMRDDADAVADALNLRRHPAAPVGVPDDTWPRLELWFFRELSSAQRLSLLKLHGFPVDEIGESLILQKRSLRRLLAAAPSAPEEGTHGWHPIKTAPKDKVLDLGTVYPSGLFVRTTDCYWRERGFWKGGWTSKNWDSEEGRLVHSPTHWRPLPESPPAPAPNEEKSRG